MEHIFDSSWFGKGSRKGLAYRLKRKMQLSTKTLKWRDVIVFSVLCTGLYFFFSSSQLSDFTSKSGEAIATLNENPTNNNYKHLSSVGQLPRMTRKMTLLLKRRAENNKIRHSKKEDVETLQSQVRPKMSMENRPRAHPPIILVWKAMEYQMKRRDELLEFYTPIRCGGCQVTTNRSLVRDCAALVHFNSPDLRKEMDVPDPRDRNPNQIYAFWSRETPTKTHHFSDVLRDPRLDSIFNLTINFRLDSDIIDYFGNLEYELRLSMERQERRNFDDILARKNGLAVWAVSNCDSTYGAAMRMKYAKKLIKAGLNVTAYGECFNNKNNGADFNHELARHKFYISFENSIHCPDYVSEKFWRNGLRSGAVPIVWGPTREDVAKVAPPHSYIHTEDFTSARKLVEYLNYLDKNDTAYREYHAWRSQPIDWTIPYEDIIPNHWSTLCRLCKKVVKKPLLHKTVPSIADWLYKTGYVDDLCFK